MFSYKPPSNAPCEAQEILNPQAKSAQIFTMRRYTVTKPTFQHHYNAVCEETGQEYFADIRGLPKKDTPHHLSIHRGMDKSGPAAGYVHYPAFTKSWKVAFCDSRDPDAVEWEDVACVKHSNTAKWRWSVIVPPRHAGSEAKRRVFIWTRTRNVGIDGRKPSGWTNRHWKLQEEGGVEGAAYVAIFTAETSKGKCGTLEIMEDFRDDFNEKLFVTLMGLHEKARRSGGG